MYKQYDLSGIWRFAMDPDKTGVRDGLFETLLPDTIPLPGTTAQAGKGTYNRERGTGFLTERYPFCGWAWYQTVFTPDPADLHKPLLLTLERTRMTRLWINGTELGSCNSLTTPHRYQLPPLENTAPLTITICVSNTDYPTKGGHMTSPDTQTNWNGITGEISLTVLPQVHLTDLQAYPDAEHKSVTLRGMLRGASCGELTVTGCAFSKDAPCLQEIAPVHTRLCADEAGAFSLQIPLGEDALLWSEYTPVLYALHLSLSGSPGDAEIRFGLRSLTTADMEFRINGAPVMLRGKHDGMLFPLTGATPTDLDEWLRLLGIAKAYGINHYRYHTCCPPEAAFTAADLLGIYMQPELPFWGTLAAPGEEQYNETEQAYLVEEGFRMLRAFGSHPSFCMLSLGNELWGSSRQMAQILRGYRQADPRHLYTQGSNNFQFWPCILEEDDFFSGVRLSKERLIRGSYASCDRPLGHIQTARPSTDHSYDPLIFPEQAETRQTEAAELEIQYGTGVKTVRVEHQAEGLIPHKPIVTHEIGQYTVYPDYAEIPKFTGVLAARNFEVFRERLAGAGMEDQARDFFLASGHLAAQCYKEEIEAAMRSRYIAGFQLLDLQDFTGQGTALVGMLDAFMDSKGLISEKQWRGFCSDAVLLAEFDRYNYAGGEAFRAQVQLRCYRPDLTGTMHWRLTDGDACLAAGRLPLPSSPMGLVTLGMIEARLPDPDTTRSLTLTLEIPETDVQNTYIIYVYPNLQPALPPQVKMVHTVVPQALELLGRGARVLLVPDTIRQAVDGFYCSDFWCYPMFRQICESMDRPVAVGTMGLLVDKEHPAVSGFARANCTTPQWYDLITHARCAVLEHAAPGLKPILQMIDNFERNHKLGLLFEARVGAGRLMVCTIRLHELADRIEGKAFTEGLYRYMASGQFAPRQELTPEQLVELFGACPPENEMKDEKSRDREQNRENPRD